ncbi:MAG TPA: UDP-N-acetylmuramoyl-L-alanyl-D-glutamate--2,6-diaminopimelate ligase [Prosthecobacter sp.]|nr:UDP-N-acetylmuramoyl-L-alanyl-D-glutamate--2,6-diaminopimelate ligase [Prosthecobacter sp.]
MTLRDLITHLDKPVASGDLDTPIQGLTYDSRKAGPGIAFVALRGGVADGHDFIPKAVAAGAAAIIAEQAPPDDVTTPWVHVRFSRIALAQAAAAVYGQPGKAMNIAAVTGTNGKTTTAFLVHHLLNKAQQRCGLLGTVFYDLGGVQVPATHTTPESLEIHQLLAQMRDNGCRAVAMEVSSHALDQDRVHGLDYAAGIFTNLTQDHLDYHGSMDAYFKAKTRLFEKIASQKKGRIIINSDDAWGRKLITQFEHTGRLTKFGFGVGADLRAINPRYDLTGSSFELEFKGRSFLVRLPLIGDFNVYNALGALAAAHAMGLNLRESVNHLKQSPQVPGRLERVTENTNFRVFVDYAHTPDALENVLKTARALRPNRIITVFGCGGDRDRTKRPKMAAAAEAGSDICVLTSDNPRSEDPEHIMADAAKGFARPKKNAMIADRREAIHVALYGARPGDIVLIAGKGHEDYQEIQGKKHPFDDRKVVRQLLQQMRAARAEESEDPPR